MHQNGVIVTELWIGLAFLSIVAILIICCTPAQIKQSTTTTRAIVSTTAKLAMDFSKCSSDGNGSTARWLADGRISDARSLVRAGASNEPGAIVTDVLCGLYALASMQSSGGESGGARKSPSKTAMKAIEALRDLCNTDVICAWANDSYRPCTPPGEGRALSPGEIECPSTQ